MAGRLQNVQSIVFTGSGSSEYAGDCVRLAIQKDLKLTSQAIGSGMVLTHGTMALPPLRPLLIVSLASLWSAASIWRIAICRTVPVQLQELARRYHGGQLSPRDRPRQFAYP